MTFFYGAAVIVLALQVVAVLRSFAPSFVELWVIRLAASYSLPLPQELSAFVARHTAIRQRAIRLGQLAGLVAGIAVGPLFGLPIEQCGWVVLACGAVGWTTALCITSLRTLERPRTTGVARAVAVGLDDYFAPAQRVLVGVVIAVAIVFVPAAARIRGFEPAMWIALALTLLTFVLAEVVGRRIIAQRQPADTDLELAWNDALRAQVVRDLYGTPTGFAVGAILLALMSIAGPRLVDTVLPFLTLALVASSLVGTVITARLGLRRYVLRRLWPARVQSGWY